MLPFHEYMTKHANEDDLVFELYKNVLDDVIFCHDKTDEEIRSICENSVKEILNMCKTSSQPVKEDEGYLSTFMNGTLNEVCLFADDDKYDIMFHDWNEWMSYPVSDEVNKEEFCVAAILTMTFFGFTQEAHAKRVNEVIEELKEMDTEHTGKTYSLEEVEEHMRKLIEETKNGQD